MLRKILISLIAVFCAESLQAQPYCDVRTFTIRDGLPASIISGFEQADNGLMWFSTWNGLCYYDGYRFTTFRSMPGVNEVLTSNRLMTAKQSVTGNVWCNTSDRHAYLFDTHECRFIDVNRIIGEKTGHGVSVRGIYTLSNGYTWLVTNRGGASYRIDDNKIKDGEGIEVFSTENGNLKDNIINKVEIDSKGREWVFTVGGVNLIGGRYDSATPFEHRLEMGDTTYLATLDGKFFAYSAASVRPQAVDLPSGVGQIRQLMSFDESRMMIATDVGIVEYDVRMRSSKVLSVQNPSQPSSLVLALFMDSKKRVWAYSDGPGITKLDVESGDVKWYTAKAATHIERTTSNRFFFHEDKLGTVWVVPQDGTFSYYSEADDRLVPYVLKSDKHQGTDIPIIDKYTFDSEKNLWLTSMRDVSLVNFKYHHFKFTPVSTNQEVRALLNDSRGRTWVGTTDGLLMLYDETGGLLGYVAADGRLSSVPTLFSTHIYSLTEDDRHRIWVGTKGMGVYLLDGDGRLLNHFVSDAADKYSLSSNNIYDIHADNKGRMWLATFEGGPNIVDESDGLIRFINANNQLMGYPIDKCNKVRRITHTDDGVVIFSTSTGLLTCSDTFSSPEDIRFYMSNHVVGDTTSLMGDDVMQTIVTRNGDILAITLGGGLQRLTSKTLLQDSLMFSNLRNINLNEGIIQSAVEDSRGNIWIMRDKNIDCYELGTAHLSQYGPANIGEDVELTEAKPVFVSATGDILQAARGGFVRFDPANLTKSDYKPNIVFTGVLYHGDEEAVPLLGNTTLTVDKSHRNLSINFSALEYSDKYLVRYAYMLEGVDDKWNYVDNNSASFNRLPPGNHRLLVRSTNSDGVWVDNVAALEIRVEPTFWETIWAKFLYVLLFCGAVWVAVYIYALRSKARIEREIGEVKTRFFTEISHKLRTPLTLIGGPVTEVLNAEKLTDTARRHLEMVQRNSKHMLELVNKMLRYNLNKGVYISDEAVPELASIAGMKPVEPSVADAPIADHDESDAAMPQHEKNKGGVRLLIVEDNDDLRAFLMGILSSEYVVLQAENGRRGLEIAEREMPDFIITDVMMPEMDGLTMIHNIKQNNDICHIPIIVLSAKASLEDRLQGLSEGIDDYITKPFSALYLKSRVSNIIRQRRMLQQTYVEQITPEAPQTYKLEAPQIVDADKKMMEQLLEYLEEHIADPSLKIEDLAETVNLSRSVFYGKIKSIVGMTPIDFVRHIRMQRAEELIVKSDYTFSQISYKVGFADPKYFSKWFKKETGMTPSEYRELKKL